MSPVTNPTSLENYDDPQITAEVIEASRTQDGHTLATLVVRIPRYILPEFNTHRAFSRNSASSRAIPLNRQIEKIMKTPFIPGLIGVNQPGMQATVFLEGNDYETRKENILLKRDRAVLGAFEDIFSRDGVVALLGKERYTEILLDGFGGSMVEVNRLLNQRKVILDRIKQDARFNPGAGFIDIHKQTVNRYLEPFMYQTIVVTSRYWDHYLALRHHADAQPEIYLPAKRMREALEKVEYKTLAAGEWHLPFITEEERAIITEANIDIYRDASAARCARVSAETHPDANGNGGGIDLEKDLFLARKRLLPVYHMSPFEHQARAAEAGEDAALGGNFGDGWVQYRKTIPLEDAFHKALQNEPAVY